MKDRQLVQGFIGGIVVLAFCAFAVYVGLRQLPVANMSVINMALGALIAQFATVIGYYFGSSRSAERAQDHIAAATPAAHPNVVEVTAQAGKATERTPS